MVDILGLPSFTDGSARARSDNILADINYRTLRFHDELNNLDGNALDRVRRCLTVRSGGLRFRVPYGLTAVRIHRTRGRVDDVRLAFFDSQVNSLGAECKVGIPYATLI
jgi:hypothetical protein